MKKIIPILLAISLIFINFASAYSYGSPSLGDLFESVGEENIVLLIIFSVSFALITVIMNRTSFFGDNRAASSIISLMLAVGITYAFYRQGINFDLSNLFFNMGLSYAATGLIILILALVVLIFLFVKLKLDSLLVIGGLLLAASIFFGLSLGIGIFGGVLIAIWIFLKYIVFRTKYPHYGGGKTNIYFNDYKKPKNKDSSLFWKIILLLLLIVLFFLIIT